MSATPAGPAPVEIVVSPDASPREMTAAVALVLSRLALALELSGFAAASKSYPGVADLFEQVGGEGEENLRTIMTLASGAAAMLDPIVTAVKRIAGAAERHSAQTTRIEPGVPLEPPPQAEPSAKQQDDSTDKQTPARLISVRGGRQRRPQREPRPTKKKGGRRKSTDQ